MKLQSAVLAFAACALATSPSNARQGEPPKAPAAPKDAKDPKETKPVERATAWPTLAGDVLTSVRTDIERLRKAHTPEMAEQAEKSLVAAGAGITPELLPVLGREHDAEALGRVQGVLSKVVTAEYTRLIAAEFTNKSREVRTWVLKRCGQFPDPEIRTQAEAALAAAIKAKPRTEEAEEKAAVAEERYAAALCVTASGSLKGLDELQPFVLDEWGKRGVEMRAAFEAVRGKEATDYAGKLAFDKDRKKCVAGLNMLAGVGSKEAVLLIKPHLDSADNSIRVAAINAMRGVCDGDPPIANLPVFEAIELAKKWKSR